MAAEDAVVQLAADPAVAYRELLYRPSGPLARWIADRFEVLAGPGRPVPGGVRHGDVLIEVRLGRPGRGRCVRLDGREQPDRVLRPGSLLLRPRRLAVLTEPEPAEPSVEPSVTEHDFGETGVPAVRTDAGAATPSFARAEREHVVEPLLGAQASAAAVTWTHRTYPAVSGVPAGTLRAALAGYVDVTALRAVLERRGGPADDDTVLVEAVHQFQRKVFLDPSAPDGRAGESTLDSLGLIVRAGTGLRAADRSNTNALRRLGGLSGAGEFTAANWFSAMTDASFLGRTTMSRRGLHVLLLRRLRTAERHLLSLTAYRGMTPARLGAALGITEPHRGARPSQGATTSVHSFGLAIDIGYRANPWIRQPASWDALRNAATLISGTVLPGRSAPAYFSGLTAGGRTTAQIWDELKARSDELAAYLRLEQDPAGLLAVVRRNTGLVGDDETAEQAAHRWRDRIRLDRGLLTAGDFAGHDTPEHGFLQLPRDLVVALRDHGCLAWGAVDFGPGERGSGDMMHFDARIGGIGEQLARGDNHVPAAGHPCLSRGATEVTEVTEVAESAETEEAGEIERAGPPGVAELTERIARSIGVWETNRGGEQPRPRESALDTVAGVPASMATIEQATMPYAITVLRRHKSLRDRAHPVLTLRELNAADNRVAAVVTLLAAVSAAAAGGAGPAAFTAANGPAVAATGLGDADVQVMFRAEALRTALAQVRTAMDAVGQDAAARRAVLATAIAALPDRVGLGDASLRTYTTRPATWGENRAGWQRKAVRLMPDDVGRRIEAVAVLDDGTALILPTTRQRVDAELARTPPPNLEDLVRAVAQQNNPNEAGYGRNVWRTFRRLYP